MAQPRLLKGDGPIGLILVPTRELAMQIYNEAKKFGKVYDLQVVCAYGGGSKWEQSKGFEAGAEIAIATPGRMIDMIKMKVTNLQRVTYLVLDEADRMFDMGFEPQVRYFKLNLKIYIMYTKLHTYIYIQIENKKRQLATLFTDTAGIGFKTYNLLKTIGKLIF